MNLRAFDQPEGKSLNIMHTRSVNKALKLLASEGLRLELTLASLIIHEFHLYLYFCQQLFYGVNDYCIMKTCSKACN